MSEPTQEEQEQFEVPLETLLEDAIKLPPDELNKFLMNLSATHRIEFPILQAQAESLKSKNIPQETREPSTTFNSAAYQEAIQATFAYKFQSELDLALKKIAADFSVTVTAIKADRARIKAAQERQAAAHSPLRVFHRGDQVELAEHTLDQVSHGRPHHVIYDESRLWRYNPESGVWDALEDAEVITTAASFAGVGVQGRTLTISASAVEGSLRLIKAKCNQVEFFAHASSGMSFANGFLNAADLTFEPHSPEHRSRWHYAFDILPDPNPPKKYLKFLHRILQPRDKQAEADTLACLLGHLGASIMGEATRFQRAIFIKSAANTGGSTLLKIHTAAMPSGSVCSIAPSEMETSNFVLYGIAGKLLNVVDDLPKDELRASGKWKTCVTGKNAITVQQKNKPAFLTIPIAGHLIAFNTLPPSSDTSKGFSRRPIVIELSSPIEKGEEIPGLDEEIIREELPAIVFLALRMYAFARRNNALTVPPGSDEIVAEWMSASSPVEVFFRECLSMLSSADYFHNDRWMRARAVYDAYVEWTKSNGHKAMSSTAFGLALKTHLGRSRAEYTTTPYRRPSGAWYPVAIIEDSIRRTMIADAENIDVDALLAAAGPPRTQTN